MFSRKKKTEIPAVDAQRSELLGGRGGNPAPPPSYRSNSSLSSSAGGAPPAGPSYGNPYGGGGQGGAYYGRQPTDPSADARRSELLKGARAPKPGFADRDLDKDMAAMREGRPVGTGGGGGGGGGGAEDEEEEVEAIKQQIRFTKQESLSSTRNALRIARETEETARGTLSKLGDQSDRIANTERQLDLAKAHASRAEDEAKEIVRLNRSIFRPSFTWDKKGKRDAEEHRIMTRHLEEKEEREETRRGQLESRNRTEGALKKVDRDRAAAADAKRGGGGLKSRLAERSRYQFENTGSDDELEDELDTNLDEISALTGRLKTLGQTMGTEIESQNKTLDAITGKTDRLDTNLYGQTERLKRIK